MERDKGASDKSDRATAAEPEVSALRDGIPSAASVSKMEIVQPVQNLHTFTYRLRDTDDPEERLEDAAMFKALHDVSRGNVVATKAQVANFGAVGGAFRHVSTLPYWTDPAFLGNCGRQFHAVPFEQAEKCVTNLHARGMDAFLKSGFDKYYIAKVRRGESFREVVSDMAYSFIESPVPLMVQELVDFTFEHRFFVVKRKIVTFSPAAYTLTPLDFPTPPNYGWRKQADRFPVPWSEFYKLHNLATRVAAGMRLESAVIDIGMIGANAAVVEFNPLRAGGVGLFACDVRSLAAEIYAQAIEARRAATTGAVHESAVGATDAPHTTPESTQ